jgi:hypothetical protein
METNNNWQQLPKETTEQHQLFLSFAEFEGTIEQWYNAIKPEKSLPSIMKYASKIKFNWTARKKAYLTQKNCKPVNINSIKEKLLYKLDVLTSDIEENITKIEILVNCIYKLHSLNCEIKKETKQDVIISAETKEVKKIEPEIKPVIEISKKNDGNAASKPKQATVSTGSYKNSMKIKVNEEQIKAMIDKYGHLQVESEPSEYFCVFCEYLEFDNNTKTAKPFIEAKYKEYEVSIRQLQRISEPKGYNWIARKKQYLVVNCFQKIVSK